MENDANIIFLPCRHLMYCNKCTVNIKICPICKITIIEQRVLFRKWKYIFINTNNMNNMNNNYRSIDIF